MCKSDVIKDLAKEDQILKPDTQYMCEKGIKLMKTEIERRKAQELGKFGHHPDKLIDVCVELDRLAGETYEAKAAKNIYVNKEIFKYLEGIVAVGKEELLKEINDNFKNSTFNGLTEEEYLKSLGLEEINKYIDEERNEFTDEDEYDVGFEDGVSEGFHEGKGKVLDVITNVMRDGSGHEKIRELLLEAIEE